MEFRFVRPKVPGSKVPDPERGGYLPGEVFTKVPNTPFWTRRVLKGDVEENSPAADSPAAAPESRAEKPEADRSAKRK
ncbi:MAG: DUF2635 domain-containing protein, partial [Bdellovibrionota bacterium]